VIADTGREAANGPFVATDRAGCLSVLNSSP